MGRAVLKGHTSSCFGTMYVPCLIGEGGNMAENCAAKEEGEGEGLGVSEGLDKSSLSPHSQILPISRISSHGSSSSSSSSRCISWSSDTTVKEWDVGIASGVCTTPLRGTRIEGYPVYSCSVGITSFSSSTFTGSGRLRSKVTVACAGGNSANAGFAGIPVQIYEF